VVGYAILGAGSAFLLFSLVYALSVLVTSRRAARTSRASTRKPFVPQPGRPRSAAAPLRTTLPSPSTAYLDNLGLHSAPAPLHSTVPAPSVAYLDNLKFVIEQTTRNNMAFWDRPCIDTLGYALDTRVVLLELVGDAALTSLRQRVPNHEPRLRFDRSLPAQTPSKTRLDLSAFFDPATHAPALRPDLWVSTTAIDYALRIILGMTTYDDSTGPPSSQRYASDNQASILFRDWLDGCYRHLLNNINDSGIVADTARDDLRVVANHSGWASLARLRKTGQVIDGDANLGRKPIDLQGFVDWFRSHMHDAPDWQAFSDEAGGAPAVCSTFNAATTIACLPLPHRDFAVRALGLSGYKVLSFINRCYVSEGGAGGYSWVPGEEPTVAHTRFALALVRTLMSFGVPVASDNFPVKASAIVRFLHSMWGPMGCNSAVGIAPTLYATRNALLAAKYLEILRWNGVFRADDEYIHARDSFIDQAAASLDQVLDVYRHPRKDGYAGFPVARVPP